jgi:excisionase family DNA binding protein
MKEHIHFSLTIQEFEMILNRIVKAALQPSVPVTPLMADPEYLTRKQVRALIGVSNTTLNNWRKNGTLPACKIGAQVRYVKADVIAHIERIKQP